MSINYHVDSSSDKLLELSTVLNLCELVNSPRSIAVFMLLSSGEHTQYLDLEIDANNYEDHCNFADDYLVTSILRKSINLDITSDPRDSAVSSFWEAERMCAATNQRLSATFWHEHPPFYKRMRRIIQSTLGTLDLKALKRISDRSRFGPGATTGVTGRGVVPSKKFDADMHLTEELIHLYKPLLGQLWWEIQPNPLVVVGNKFTTVPKNATTHRGICIEPTLNVFGQLGCGAYIRDSLRRLGIDLKQPRLATSESAKVGQALTFISKGDDEPLDHYIDPIYRTTYARADRLKPYEGCVSWKRNQVLAQKAYTLKLATIDLSKASDTLSLEVVKQQLPDPWFDLLDLFRSKTTTIDGAVVPLNKFSSMGNGFTFELETLIFRALVLSIVPIEDQHLTSVFGDDIICPQEYASEVIDALTYLGFSVNTKKSFLAGNFFESCGSDFFKGQPVRPFYLRRQKMGNRFLPYTVQIANALRIYANRRGYGVCCDSRFLPLWTELRRACPVDWQRCKIPFHFGDTGIVSDLSEVKIRRHREGWEGYQVRYKVLEPIFADRHTIGRLLAALAGGAGAADPLFSKGREPKRGYLRRVRTKTGLSFAWPDGWTWAVV
jgi:hypothetical protein